MYQIKSHPRWLVALGLATVAIISGAGRALAAEIQRPPMVAALPDLAVEKITFEVVEQRTWADGTTPCQLFNLHATLANLGLETSMGFQVRVERKNPGWELAGPNSTISEPAMAPKERRELAPRQFNNCGANAPTQFRVVIDPLGQPDAKATNDILERTYLPKPVMPKPVPVERKKVEGR